MGNTAEELQADPAGQNRPWLYWLGMFLRLLSSLLGSQGILFLSDKNLASFEYLQKKFVFMAVAKSSSE